MCRLSMVALRYIPLIFVMNANAQLEPEMVAVPAACVQVGTLLMDHQASNSLREVCIDSFHIGRYEVTFEEYDQFTEDTGRAARHDVGFGREDRPVIDVNWFDAVAYADWLSKKTDKTYRLPTDAEWEYAARIHTDFEFRYSWGAEQGEDKANCRNCGSQWDAQMTSPVGSFDPNALGIYDMHGNVWEWTSDCYRANRPRDVDDKQCRGVVRGGSWDVEADQLVFWVRAPYLREMSAQDVGFRLVMERQPRAGPPDVRH